MGASFRLSGGPLKCHEQRRADHAHQRGTEDAAVALVMEPLGSEPPADVIEQSLSVQPADGLAPASSQAWTRRRESLSTYLRLRVSFPRNLIALLRSCHRALQRGHDEIVNGLSALGGTDSDLPPERGGHSADVNRHRVLHLPHLSCFWVDTKV